MTNILRVLLLPKIELASLVYREAIFLLTKSQQDDKKGKKKIFFLVEKLSPSHP